MTTGIAERWAAVRSSYWFIPGLMAIGSGALALLMVAVDGYVGAQVVDELGWIYAGGPDGARGVLASIAGSMITVAGVTFSVLVVALSMAASQFGPRVLGSFMRDTGNQFVLGAFTGTFLYCLLVLRTIRGGEDSATFVPHLSVTVGVALAVIGVGVLIYFVHHAAVSIQVGSIIASLAEDLDAGVERLFPPRPQDVGGRGGDGPPTRHDLPVRSGKDGYVQGIDVPRLVREAEERGLLVEVSARVGDFVARGDVMARYRCAGERDAGLGEALREAFLVGHRRTPTQDVDFSVQQLTDVAVRALSPGINDPFTATVCLDRVGAALARAAERPAPACLHCGGDRRVRVWSRPDGFGTLVQTAFGPLRDYAGGSATVLLHMLRTLLRMGRHAADPERAAVVRTHAGLVLATAERSLPEPTDRAAARAVHAEILGALEQPPVRTPGE